MKHLLLGAAAAALLSCAAPCGAESWIFNQSYYSHDPVTRVRIGRQYSRGPVFTRSQGEYINTGYRNLRSTINIRGQTFDMINMFESWIQVGAKF